MRAKFRVTLSSPTILEVMDNSGQIWETVVFPNFADIKQEGVGDDGKPNFRFDMGWSARWELQQQIAPVAPVMTAVKSEPLPEPTPEPDFKA